ncbi:MAG: T9SS type A sorting domain-containing protein, partial [Bacteroidota bacterium]
ALEEVVVTKGRRRHKIAYSAVPADGAYYSKSAAPTSTSPARADYATTSSAPAIRQSNVRSGLLTAGEIHDFSKWKLWGDIASDQLQQWQAHWQIHPKERYTVQLKTSNNSAVIDASVRLIDKAGAVVWETRSDNTGKAELWANIFQTNTKSSRYSIEVLYEGERHVLKNVEQFHNGINLMEIPIPCYNNQLIDITFVVDATGSMGDEIEYLKAELNDIIGKVKDTLPDIAVRLGTVFYRDEGEEYLTKKSAFSDEIEKTTAFISAQTASGGGDFPEAVESALAVAIDSMQWSETALGRFLFLVLDAPPHHNPEVVKKLQALSQKAAAKGVRIIPVTGSGIDKSTEYLMRTLALMTNGTYVFLTDDSGIGNGHIKPTTDSYEVELLNDLLVRLIYQYTYVPKCDDRDLQALEAPDTNLINDSKDEVLSKISWKYFPNPTDGLLNVHLKGKLDHLFLTDFAGKILQRHDLNDVGQLELDLGNFPSGIYYLKAINGEADLSAKVILAR